MPDGANQALLQGIVAFTGRLATMRRDEAFAVIRQHGGTPRRGVTKKTSLLIVGEEGWPLLGDGQPTNSLKRARELGTAIVSEREFLEWIGRAHPDDQQKSFRLEQIATQARLPESIIDELSIYGLIQPRDGLYGFRDLAAARQIGELLGAGVSLSTISRSLREIRKWLPDAGLASVKLYPESADALLVRQLGGLTDKRGQFVLPVGEAADDPDLVFEEAQAAEDAGDLQTAERLYRKVAKIDPADTAAVFNLANLLRRLDRPVEAEASYRSTLKTDPRFAEAWYNLADLVDDAGRPEQAIDYLQRALDAAPDYADAVFNLASLHQRLGRNTEAAENWRRYLAFDSDSPWAGRARRALRVCELARRARA